MIAGLLVAIAAAAPPTLVVQERVPVAVVVNTPTGQAGRISRSEVIRIVGDLLKRHTDFFPQLVDEQVVEDCKGSLTCVATTTRRDYERETLVDRDGKLRPYAAHEQRIAERGLTVPRFLVMVSNIAGSERGDRMSVLLLDLTVALATFHEAPRESGWQDDVEVQISERAVVASSRPALVLDEAEAQTVLARAFERSFATALAKAGHWEPFGAIALDVDADDVAIEIDGQAVGVTKQRQTLLTGVAPGSRTLTLRRTGYATLTTTIDVRSRETVRHEAKLVPVTATGEGAVRTSVIWGGALVAAVGVAVTIWGVSRADGSVTSHCFADQPDCSSRSDFISLGYDPSRSGAGNDAINPSGVRIVPLGYSLALAGGTWSLGSLLFADENDTPWIPLAAGVVLGALGYGLGAAL